jgi:hypothetical protein
LPIIFSTAEAAMEARAAPRYPVDGILAVCDSMLEVNWSSCSPLLREVVLGKVMIYCSLYWFEYAVMIQDRIQMLNEHWNPVLAHYGV